MQPMPSADPIAEPTEAQVKSFPIFGGPNATENWKHIPDPPPWREFHGDPLIERTPPRLSEKDVRRAMTFSCDDELKITVSAAIALRRPILVTGSPGTGKSTLAYAVAHDLGLGAVLRWNITSRSTLRDGLYSYDALDRLNEASLHKVDDKNPPPPVGRFIKLGPLGTALLPTEYPRVLLIDELDKSDIDLPNDLLNIFEEGFFEIPELLRAKDETADVLPHDAKTRPANPDRADTKAVPEEDRVTIRRGRVSCNAFPVVFLTSNKERQFSPAFLRRCVQYEFRNPGEEELKKIALAHLEGLHKETLEEIVTAFMAKKGLVATDQLLNALYLLSPDRAAGRLTKEEQATLRETLLKELTQGGMA